MSVEGKRRQPDEAGNLIPFRLFANRSETVNLNAASLQTQEREAGEVSLPISMHTGQILMLTKLLTATDLQFYDL